jgi:DNA-binding transcriptional ArsR family regulator
MMHDQQSADIVSLVTDALADPRRYAILKQIANERAPLSYAALRQKHDIGAPTMSHHLKRLAEANLIKVIKQGKRTTVVLRPESVEEYLRAVERQLRLG